MSDSGCLLQERTQAEEVKRGNGGGETNDGDDGITRRGNLSRDGFHGSRRDAGEWRGNPNRVNRQERGREERRGTTPRDAHVRRGRLDSREDPDGDGMRGEGAEKTDIHRVYKSRTVSTPPRDEIAEGGENTQGQIEKLGKMPRCAENTAACNYNWFTDRRE